MNAGTRHAPPILHACRLSRKVGLWRFDLLESRPFGPSATGIQGEYRPSPPIYVDYTSDIFLFASYLKISNPSIEDIFLNGKPMWLLFGHAFPLVDLNRIRNAVIHWKGLEPRSSEFNLELERAMPQLERTVAIFEHPESIVWRVSVRDCHRCILRTVDRTIRPLWDVDWRSRPDVNLFTTRDLEWSVLSCSLGSVTRVNDGIGLGDRRCSRMAWMCNKAVQRSQEMPKETK